MRENMRSGKYLRNNGLHKEKREILIFVERLQAYMEAWILLNFERV